MPFRRSRSRLRLRKNFRNQFAGSNKPVPRAPDGKYHNNNYYTPPSSPNYHTLDNELTYNELTYNDIKYFPLIQNITNAYEDNVDNNSNNVNEFVVSVKEMFNNFFVIPKDFRDLNNILKAEAEAINPHRKQEINIMIETLLDNNVFRDP